MTPDSIPLAIVEILTFKTIIKWLVFPPLPRLRPPLGGSPLEFLDKTYPAKTRGMGLLYAVYGENCVIPYFSRF